MSNISMLIKPASSGCNMRCRYCFYADEAQNREIASFGVMTPETLENVVKRAFERARSACTFAFQGGEPTLAGLPFFKRLPRLVEKYNTRRIPVYYALQTNGMLLDDEWAAFFAQYHFLVGLSLDGPKEVHDRYRVDAQGNGTYSRVLRAAQILTKFKVDYNLLTVVTEPATKCAGKIYNFFMRSGFYYQQYIPCLDPLGEKRGGYAYSLTPEGYSRFLKSLFDCWYQDVRRGRFVYNRYFENLAALLSGKLPESCGMLGHCTLQYVVEADGSVYPCDFYALDQYFCGNVNTDTLDQIDTACEKTGFIQESRTKNEECARCEYYLLCHGGCRRDRDSGDGGVGHNYFCQTYQEFFPYAIPRLQSVIRR